MLPHSVATLSTIKTFSCLLVIFIMGRDG
jgi:hypothetical protein